MVYAVINVEDPRGGEIQVGIHRVDLISDTIYVEGEYGEIVDGKFIPDLTREQYSVRIIQEDGVPIAGLREALEGFFNGVPRIKEAAFPRIRQQREREERERETDEERTR